MSPKRKKAPPGMPPAMAKALKLKQPGAPRRNPVPPRESNPLQHLLQRGSEGKGVILSGPQATQLAAAFMDSQNWVRQTSAELTVAHAEQEALIALWTESGMEAAYEEGEFDDTAYKAFREALLGSEDDEGEDA